MDFKLWQPSGIEEAMSWLAEMEHRALPLAGGTDLLVKLRSGFSCPNLVDLQGLEELQPYRTGGEETVIGSLCLVSTVEWDAALRSSVPCLPHAAGQLGSRQVRNLATVGGNLCNASPSAELAPPLLALDAVAETTGPGGCRSLPLAQFFTGPGKTALGRGELLKSVRFRRPQGRWAARYYKLSPRKAMDIAVVNVCVRLTLDDKDPELIRDAAISAGAAAPTPLRFPAEEEALRGRRFTPELAERAARACGEAVRPIDDLRASAAYRKEMVRVLVRRGLAECYEQLYGREGAQ